MICPSHFIHNILLDMILYCALAVGNLFYGLPAIVRLTMQCNSSLLQLHVCMHDQWIFTTNSTDKFFVELLVMNMDGFDDEELRGIFFSDWNHCFNKRILHIHCRVRRTIAVLMQQAFKISTTNTMRDFNRQLLWWHEFVHSWWIVNESWWQQSDALPKLQVYKHM